MATILIPPPRIPVIDQKTGLMAQAWYAFFSQFLQGLSSASTGTETDLTALTLRVLATETDITSLEAEDAGLFVDIAMPAGGAEIDELRKRVADLETEWAMLTGQAAAIDELRKRLADLETDIEIRT